MGVGGNDNTQNREENTQGREETGGAVQDENAWPIAQLRDYKALKKRATTQRSTRALTHASGWEHSK